MAINSNNPMNGTQASLRTVLGIIIFFVLFASNTRAQSALRLKLYDKEVVFDERYLDKSFATLINTKKALSKDQNTAYSEYTYFKKKVIEGNKINKYIVVNNLRRFSLGPFDISYYAQEGTDNYRWMLKAAKNAGVSSSFKRTQKVRNDI